LITAGVDVEGYREILGVWVGSAEDGAGWLAFFRDLVTRLAGGKKYIIFCLACSRPPDGQLEPLSEIRDAGVETRPAAT
jgi:hypothetical protein